MIFSYINHFNIFFIIYIAFYKFLQKNHMKCPSLSQSLVKSVGIEINFTNEKRLHARQQEWKAHLPINPANGSVF